MINEKKITCILCPIGCKILVKIKDGECRIIDGSKCKKGEEYAINEILNPKRILTTSILIENGVWPLVSVRSTDLIPKEKLFHVLKEIKKKKIQAPVKSGHIIIKNVAETGINIIATKSVKDKKPYKRD
jgi:CxxC motif-containing protein